MRIPVATYRPQLQPGFGFREVRELLPYLHELGITDLYVPPLFQARPGSTHGYDVTSPLRLNPELGSPSDFEALVCDLQGCGMGLLLDIVPNHMAASPANPWWMDVLENGLSSPYASFFDIEWHPVMAKGSREDKVLLPVLGEPYGVVLEDQKFTLALDEDGFFVRYYELRFPLDPSSYSAVVPDCSKLQDLRRAIADLPPRTVRDPARIEQRRRDKEIIKRMLWDLYRADPDVRAALNVSLKTLNGSKSDPRSFDSLDQLLRDQAYRPALWRLGAEESNYWRFFDITDLVSIRTEDPDVLRKTHDLIFQLIRDGKVTGLRVDHIDGLYDPLGYLQRLRSSVADAYVIVEKILLGEEKLPGNWPVCGTTGYDFLSAVNGVLADPKGVEALTDIYAKTTGLEARFPEVVYEQKRHVIERLFRGELRVLRDQLGLLAQEDRHARDLSPKELTEALAAVTSSLPVYRTYIREFEVSLRNRSYIMRALALARQRSPDIGSPVFDFLRRVLLLEFPANLAEQDRDAWLRLVMRWQQFTAPVTAKGLEDTALYVYNRLISLNEIGTGDAPMDLEAFHRFNASRQRQCPFTLNATSTHDAKRSEDVRARINVLSETPDIWERRLRRWSRWNGPCRRTVHGSLAPDPNEEILLYQTLLGAWPLVAGELPEFVPRLKSYLVKAAREAKVHTSWLSKDPEYERALEEFAGSILEDSPQNRFLADFRRFQKNIAFYGAINSLSQVVLKIMSPGSPDFYQNTMTWDFSLVDPDNRRPIDFPKRMAPATAHKDWQPDDLLVKWQDGRIKLYVIAKALHFRKAHLDLFLNGEYRPLTASGRRQGHVIAFARVREKEWAVAAVPRFVSRFCDPDRFPLGRRRWGETFITLPEDAAMTWRNIFTGETVRAGASGLALGDVLHRLPVAILAGT